MTGRVLVTGSTGFIGAHVIRELRLAHPGLHVVEAGRHHAWPLDLADPDLALPPKVDTVLHLAGEKADVARMRAVNYDGTLALVEAAAKAGVRHFVHLSSVGVYGAGARAATMDEAYAHTPHGPYETSKDAAEREVVARCKTLNMRCVVVQPSNVLGISPSGGRPLLGLTRMVARGWFCHFGRDETWVNYVSVQDVAAAIVLVCTRADAQGTFIVNTPAPLRHFVGWVASELGRPAPQVTVPYWVGAMAGAAGSIVGSLLRRDLPLSSSRLRELTTTTRFDGSAIERRLGFHYSVGIESALRALIRQYRKEGLV
jgi:UDP-glucose 4-epimerase